jgi:hypothetical protein
VNGGSSDGLLMAVQKIGWYDLDWIARCITELLKDGRDVRQILFPLAFFPESSFVWKLRNAYFGCDKWNAHFKKFGGMTP